MTKRIATICLVGVLIVVSDLARGAERSRWTLGKQAPPVRPNVPLSSAILPTSPTVRTTRFEPRPDLVESLVTSPIVVRGQRAWSWTGEDERNLTVARWKFLDPLNAPPPRFRALMVFDTDRQRVIMFGGFDENNRYTDETWVFDGQAWKRLDVSSPPADPAYVMAYDAGRGMTVLYGGRSRQTWEFDGKAWARVRCENSPPIIGFGAMAYDPANRRIVMFGGEALSSANAIMPTLSDECWQYDGLDWSRMTASGPSARKYHQMVYDSARERLVVFGGFSWETLNDTWELRSSGWRKVETPISPPPRRGFAMTYDPIARQTLLLGGFPGGDELWAFDGAVWTRVRTSSSPPYREGAGFLYIPPSRCCLLFGGLSSMLLKDSWALVRPSPQPVALLPPPGPEIPPEERRPAPPVDIVRLRLDAVTSPALAELYFRDARMTESQIAPGREFHLTGWVVNSGTKDARCLLEFWLTPTQKPLVRQVSLCAPVSVEVKARQSYDLARMRRLARDNLPTGRFYVAVEADRLCEVAETDKTNNVFVTDSPSTVSATVSAKNPLPQPPAPSSVPR